MEDKLAIKLNIAERVYPLTVARSEEEKYRKATKLINEMIRTYKQRFPSKDMHDFLGMVSLNLATKNIEKEFDPNMNELLLDLKELSNEIESFIIENNDL
ncbi:MAG: cell division protein ZapA [Bacteroidales bacterium]|nr:cell division protein ZapA [Bacteroidales bacterium]